jgi:hypothetical protein
MTLTADPAFVKLARAWMQAPADTLLTLVWAAYDNMRATPPPIDARSLERSITQRLEARINDAMSGDEPFRVQHGAFEYETMAQPPAQPPQYDIAFVLRSDERLMWPLEAKVLETAGQLSEYLEDVRDQFLTCRYAPFSGSAAMLGYLLSGDASEALAGISKKLGCEMHPPSGHSSTRPHRTSHHVRTVPIGKSYPSDFVCHHLVLEFLGLKRHS